MDSLPRAVGFSASLQPAVLLPLQVSDFGLTILTANAPGSASKAAANPAYLAPEILDGAPASAASDVFALALVLFEASWWTRVAVSNRA